MRLKGGTAELASARATHATSIERGYEKLKRRFAGAQFRCSRCQASGYPSLRPGPGAAQRQGDTIIDLYCPHCLPPWEMIDARLEQGQAFACPGCRRPLLMHTRKEPPTAAAFSLWSHLTPKRSES